MFELNVEFERKIAVNGTVEISYIAAGSGPPLVFLHGIPDHGYGWRRQIEAFAPHYRVLAPDLRGIGKSSAPSGHAHYALQQLVGDVLSVFAAEEISQASIVGHDWGATIAWWLAIRVPQAVRHLVALSTPHPRHFLYALADPANAEILNYIRGFRMPGAAGRLDPEQLASWVPNEQARAALIETLTNSDLECMLNYHRANLAAGNMADIGPLPLVRAPTLVMFGKQDQIVPTEAFVHAHHEVDSVSSVIAIPSAGHFIHHEVADFVTGQIGDWIAKPLSYYRDRDRQ